MKITQKIKLKLTGEQEVILDSQSKICNWLYNQFLEARINGYKWYKKSFSYYDCNAYLPEFKRDNPFLRTVYSQVLKEALRRLDKSYSDFFRRVKVGEEKPGFPKFRKWNRKWFSLVYPKNKGYKFPTSTSCYLTLGKNGDGKQLHLEIAFKEALKFPINNIIGLTITKERGSYYISINYEVLDVPKRVIERVVAIDPNHKNIFQTIDNDGRSILLEGYKIAKYFNRQLDKLKSKRDKCKKGGRRWTYLNKAIERLYFRSREQIKTMVYTIANYLCRNYDAVLYGDYVPFVTQQKYFHRGMLNESLVGLLRRTVVWVAEKTGTTFEKVNERRTTKTCSQCGYVIKGGLDPSQRVFLCPKCGLELPRDLNSAINIYNKTNIASCRPLNDDVVQCTVQMFYSPFIGLQEVRQTNQDVL